jgi:hypothetical protein
MFNTNTLHNLLNIAIAAIAALSAFNWEVLFSQSTALMIVGGLASIKGVINVLRDGFSGLTKPQPPVEQ